LSRSVPAASVAVPTYWHGFIAFLLKIYMKAVSIILIVGGILMLVLGNITYTRKEKVVDVGPVEINKKEKKSITWPNYAGAVVTVAGVVILLVSGRKRN
jgi:hypothetical protein